MTEQGRQARALQHSTSLQYEIAEKTALGWFLVFNTLTVRNEHLSDVFQPGSLALQQYLKRLENSVAKQNYGSVRAAKDAHFHTYFAVVEAGSKTGRLHIHVLHLLKHLPQGARDPNFGSVKPCKREIASMKGLWPYGHSMPIAVRYSLNDAFGLIGWRWPADTKTGQGLPVKSPQAIAGYMSKYVLKSYTSQHRSDYLWRVRKTRGLGTGLLSRMVSTLTTKTLQAIADHETIKTTINNQTVPPRLLRILTIKELQNRSSSQSLFAMAKNTTAQPSMLTQLRALTQTSESLNLQNTTSSVITHYSSADISNAQNELDQASAQFDETYFPRTTHGFVTQSTRDVS